MENKKLKYFWNKPWHGWGGVLIWFLLLFCGAFVAVLCVALISMSPGTSSVVDTMAVSAVLAFAITLIIVLLFLVIPWLCSWRNLKRVFFVLVCFATLVALFYVEENWRGKHAWEKFKREQEAKGEHFDFASIIPSPVPDDQNFAMAPIWVEEISALLGMERTKAWYGDKIAALGHTNFVRRLQMAVQFWGKPELEFTNQFHGWQQAEKTDLKAWQGYYKKLANITNAFPVPAQSQTPAEDVMSALSKYDSTIEELRKASQLPYTRFPLTYDSPDPATILLPHLASMKGCSQTLQLRAIAELQANQGGKALDDVKLALRLTDSVRGESIVISHLVRIAMLNITFQPIWEGLAERKWSDAELVALDRELAKLDFLADCESCLRGELGFATKEMEYLRRTRSLEFLGYIAMDDGQARDANEDLTKFVYRFCPGGWFYQNHLRYCRFFIQYYLPAVDVTQQLAFPKLAERANNQMLEEVAHPNPYNFIEGKLLPALGKLGIRFANCQNTVNLARVAIALERYRLANREFPESLDTLAPRFMEKIPHDIIGGQPLHYRRTNDGQFILYSIGWNEKDDEGVVALTHGGNTDSENGDWVWRYPEK